MSHNGEQPSFQAKQRFDQLLFTIANHQFVTPASRRKRAELGEIALQAADTFKSAGANHAVFFPAGSVAVGMATDKSDIDAAMVYDSDKKLDISWDYDPSRPADLYVRTLPVTLTADATVERLQDLNDVRFRTLVGDFYDEGMPDVMEPIYIVFHPSLNEFTDPNEKSVVDSWRRDRLEQLRRLVPASADILWDGMREVLESSLINYDLHEGVRKRRKRVEDVTNRVIRERFPDSETLQRRGASYIEYRRRQLEFPAFSEMCQAFKV